MDAGAVAEEQISVPAGTTMSRLLLTPCVLDLPGFTTAMDDGSVAIGKEPMRPTAMDGEALEPLQ